MTTPQVPPRSGPRTEWKTLVAPERADAVFARARELLRPDPHVRDHASCSYRVESIYLDTPALDCFARRGAASLPKYRVQRYGDGTDVVFAEEKRRRGLSVWKRRLRATEDAVASLFRDGPDDDPLAWFRAKIRMLRLRPTLLVIYGRRAHGGVRCRRDGVDLRRGRRRQRGHVLSVRRQRPPAPCRPERSLKRRRCQAPSSL